MRWTDTARLTVNDTTGELYWDGKKVVTGKVIILQRYERVLATIVAVATVAGAIHPYAISFGWW